MPNEAGKPMIWPRWFTDRLVRRASIDGLRNFKASVDQELQRRQAEVELLADAEDDGEEGCLLAELDADDFRLLPRSEDQ